MIGKDQDSDEASRTQHTGHEYFGPNSPSEVDVTRLQNRSDRSAKGEHVELDARVERLRTFGRSTSVGPSPASVYESSTRAFELLERRDCSNDSIRRLRVPSIDPDSHSMGSFQLERAVAPRSLPRVLDQATLVGVAPVSCEELKRLGLARGSNSDAQPALLESCLDALPTRDGVVESP